MPKEETIELRHIRGVVGEKEDHPNSDPRASLMSRLQSLALQSKNNPNLIHSIGNNQNINKRISIADGDYVSALYSDGTYLYTTHTDASKISKIQLNDFIVCSTLNISIANFDSAWSLASDGKYLYVGSADDLTPAIILKINLENFTIVDSLSLGVNGQVDSLFSDGSYLYAGILVASNPAAVVSIYKINLNNFLGVPTILSFAAGKYNVTGLTSDGNYLYAGIWDTGGTVDITKIDLDTFTETSTLLLPQTTGRNPQSLVIEGKYLYAGTSPILGSGCISKIDLDTFKQISYIDMNAGDFVKNMTSDGSYLYAVLGSTNIQKISLSNFTTERIISSSINYTQSLYNDGTYLYFGGMDVTVSLGEIERQYIIPSISADKERIQRIQEASHNSVINSETTSAGAGTMLTLIDSTRTEADNYWNGMGVLILSGNSIGQLRTISGFSNATGTMTVSSAFNSIIASGTLYRIVTTNSLYDILSGGVPSTNTITGKRQVFEKVITANANSGAQTLGTITIQSCVIESIIIKSNAALPASTTCPVTGAAGAVTFIDTTLATAANLSAADDQVAWTGAVHLSATKTIITTLTGGGANPTNLTFIITYYSSSVNGGIIV